MIVVSWVAAFVCCLGYGVGSVLQADGARRAARAGRRRGVLAIVVQLPYLLGLAADGVAFLANVVAARELPLFLVQAIMTASVGVTAIVVTVRGARLTFRDWLALAGLCVGLALLMISARVGVPRPVPPAVAWIVLACCALPVIIAAVSLRLTGRASWAGLSLAAGAGFAVVAVAARGMGSVRWSWQLITEPFCWSVLIAGVLAMGCFALALQRGPVTAVTAVSFTTELIVPSGVGLAIFGDRVAAGSELPALLGFAVAVAAAIALARFAE